MKTVKYDISIKILEKGIDGYYYSSKSLQLVTLDVWLFVLHTIRDDVDNSFGRPMRTFKHDKI